MSKQTMTVGSRTLEVGNLDQVVFPDAGITQGDLIDVYRRLADTMLPHAPRNRLDTALEEV
jgi:bifunctional non-homologous end joining protein LigD